MAVLETVLTSAVVAALVSAAPVIWNASRQRAHERSLHSTPARKELYELCLALLDEYELWRDYQLLTSIIPEGRVAFGDFDAEAFEKNFEVVARGMQLVANDQVLKLFSKMKADIEMIRAERFHTEFFHVHSDVMKESMRRRWESLRMEEALKALRAAMRKDLDRR